MNTLSIASPGVVDEAAPRVCVVSEGLGHVLDEGIKKLARSVINTLSQRGPVHGISIGDDSSAAGITAVPANRLFANLRLRSEIRAFRPDMICYIPSASDTVFSFIRLRVLASAWPSAKTALVALQPRPHGAMGRQAIKWLAPDVVFVQSQARAADLRRTARNVQWLPSGVDIDQFRPVDENKKRALRATHDLPQDEFLVLHVGHITPERNVGRLIELQKRWQVVMVTGNSVGQDAGLRQRLDEAGVIVVDRYLPSIEEIYQAVDCYVFPVRSGNGSIEAPLSVLEAMACGLPVVTTPFGGLRDMFGGEADMATAGVFVANEESELPELVSKARDGGPFSVRAMVEPFSWSAIAERLTSEGIGTGRKE